MTYEVKTLTSTVAPGASQTYEMRPGDVLTVVAPPNVKGTITETPLTIPATDTTSRLDPRVTTLDMIPATRNFGPYATGANVTVVNSSNSSATLSCVKTLSQMAAYALDTSGNVTGLVGPGGSPVTLPLPNPLIANVIHRRDTLANLLALSGNVGEIMVPTDADGLVAQFGGALGTRLISGGGGFQLAYTSIDLSTYDFTDPNAQSLFPILSLDPITVVPKLVIFKVAGNGGWAEAGYSMVPLVFWFPPLNYGFSIISTPESPIDGVSSGMSFGSELISITHYPSGELLDFTPTLVADQIKLTWSGFSTTTVPITIEAFVLG